MPGILPRLKSLRRLRALSQESTSVLTLLGPCAGNNTTNTMSPQTRNFIILHCTRNRTFLTAPFFVASRDGLSSYLSLDMRDRLQLMKTLPLVCRFCRHVRSVVPPLSFPGKEKALPISHSHCRVHIFPCLTKTTLISAGSSYSLNALCYMVDHPTNCRRECRDLPFSYQILCDRIA
ncbi:hypothetical protein IW262DRAFT_176156 [Armillaria fumosa]|nr:hypothetical protein IW262DRAFT_176156 [Armillaria fumosa]